MEIVETKREKQPKVEKLTKQIKEMEEKIEMLEKEKYGKVAIELAKQLENANAEEEETSEESFVEVISEIGIWKKETDNTDPRRRFWEVIDRKKAHDILEVEKKLETKVVYWVKHAYNRSAASKRKTESENTKVGNGTSMVMPPPQRPPSAANPDYISRLKWDTEIGQPGRDHSRQ
uniref:Uncharacterized protein n=1 Tax=Romanomermis culicivorax TaxID=13658 RepID=A0A915I1Z4_ROMCU